MLAEVYAWSLVAVDKPDTMASRMAERDSSAERASNIRMQRKPSGLGAPISQIRRLRLHKMRVVSAKGVDEEYRAERAS